MAPAANIPPQGQGSLTEVAIRVDADVLSRLEQERSSMQDSDLQMTARRRLESAGRLLAHLERKDLLWPPPRREGGKLHAMVSRAAWTELKEQAVRLDIAEEILLSGVLADSLFASPLAVIDHNEGPSGYLRTDRGRGRVYAIPFEVTGFQYAFLKTLAGPNLTTREVFELAVASLAERLGRGDPPRGLRLTREVLAMASDIATREHRR